MFVYGDTRSTKAKDRQKAVFFYALVEHRGPSGPVEDSAESGKLGSSMENLQAAARSAPAGFESPMKLEALKVISRYILNFCT